MLYDQLDRVPNRILHAHQRDLDFSRATIFGAGSKGLMVLAHLRKLGITVDAFLDNDTAKHGTELQGVPVLSAEHALSSKGPVIIASYYNFFISHQLFNLGLKDFFFDFQTATEFFTPDLLDTHGQVLEKLYQELADEESRAVLAAIVKSRIQGDDGYLKISPYHQYRHPLVGPQQGDVILDAGGYWGDTALMYSRQTNRECQVFSFEPFATYHQRILDTIAQHNLDNVHPVPLGCWNEKDSLSFSTDFSAPGAYCISDTGEETVEVTDIDSFVQEHELEQVTMIKADVEGAEPQLLEGARQTIETHKPKLQISVYHQPEHLWTMRQLIDQITPGYTHYLGHHHTSYVETVLYSIHPESHGACA